MEDIFKQLGITMDFEFLIVFASLLWIRILAIVTIVPFLFGKPVPKKMQVGSAMIIMFYLFPLLKPDSPPPLVDNYTVIFALYLKEVFIGLVIALSTSIIFYGFDAAGRMIDNQRGASLARVLIPQLGEQGSLSGQLLFQMAIVLYLVFGGHLMFFQSLFESYRLIPIFEFPHVQPGLFPLMDFFIILSGQVLVLSMQIAAPVIIAILLADIILGLTNRLAPQINVWELGFNIRGFVGVLALFLSFTVIAREVNIHVHNNARNTDVVIELMQGKIPDEMKDVETPDKLKNIFVYPPEAQPIPDSVWDRTIRLLKKEESD